MVNSTTASQQPSKPQQGIWSHQTPVVFSALFDWPPRPLAAMNALLRRWVTLSRNTLFLVLAVLVYNLFLPDLSNMTSLSPDWIVPLYLRNIVLLTIVAGGLHLFLFTFRAQGQKLKYDPREQMEKSKRFLFGHQVYDNIFWSLASGVTVWTIYEVLYFWGAANGVIPILDFYNHPIAFFAWVLALPLLTSSHFYLIHRLLHWPPLFYRYHRLHHRNVHIGPWSGLSMHPVEHIIYISSVLVHYVIPSHPVIVLLHLYHRCMVPAFSHAGFEKLLVKNTAITDAADFHHQLHHRFVECNYGNVDTPWDRWFGFVHDGSDEGTTLAQARRRSMNQPQQVAAKNA